jgi:predicted RNA-binding protein Jag
MTQKSNSRILIDTNRHGIRRETDLAKLAEKAKKRKAWESKGSFHDSKPRKRKLSTDE